MSKSMEASYLILQIRGFKDHAQGPSWLLNELVRSQRALSLHPSFNACLGGLLHQADGTRSAQARLEVMLAFLFMDIDL